MNKLRIIGLKVDLQLYDEDVGKSGSRLCGCNAGPELKCTWLEEIEKKPCNTDSAFYRYFSAPFNILD